MIDGYLAEIDSRNLTQDAVGCGWTQLDAVRCSWMQLDAVGCGWMQLGGNRTHLDAPRCTHTGKSQGSP